MNDAYKEAMAIADKLMKDATEENSFEDALKRTARCAVSAINNFVLFALNGNTKAADQKLVQDCIDLLFEVNRSMQMEMPFLYLEYVPTPLTEDQKRLQQAYAEKQAARIQRQQQLIKEQRVKERSKVTKQPDLGGPLDPAKCNMKPVSREALIEHGQRKFELISRKLSGK